RRADDGSLQTLIGGTMAHNSIGSGGEMPLTRPGSARPYMLLVSSLPEAGLGSRLGDPATMVLVNNLDRAADLQAGHLRRLFGLTPAEADIAVAFADGVTTAEIARRTGRSIRTVQTHLVAIYRKTGARRQTELTTIL